MRKGALAHATLAQVGLILAEICLGWITLALVHLVCHALLRLGQYLKAPNTIHDTHRFGHAHRGPSLLERWAPAWRRASMPHRCTACVSTTASTRCSHRCSRWPVAIDQADRWLRRTVSIDGPRA